jgi:biotin transport system ATP-binding protein
MTLIAGLSQQCIMATHDLTLLEHFDREIWLDRGSVQMDGPPTTVIERYRLAYR